MTWSLSAPCHSTCKKRTHNTSSKCREAVANAGADIWWISETMTMLSQTAGHGRPGERPTHCTCDGAPRRWRWSKRLSLAKQCCFGSDGIKSHIFTSAGAWHRISRISDRLMGRATLPFHVSQRPCSSLQTNGNKKFWLKLCINLNYRQQFCLTIELHTTSPRCSRLELDRSTAHAEK